MKPHRKLLFATAVPICFAATANPVQAAIRIRNAGFYFISSVSGSADWIEREKALAAFNSMYVEIPEAEIQQKNQELRELLILI